MQWNENGVLSFRDMIYGTQSGFVSWLEETSGIPQQRRTNKSCQRQILAMRLFVAEFCFVAFSTK
jgi:hypothetical protein